MSDIPSTAGEALYAAYVLECIGAGAESGHAPWSDLSATTRSRWERLAAVPIAFVSGRSSVVDDPYASRNAPKPFSGPLGGPAEEIAVLEMKHSMRRGESR